MEATTLDLTPTLGSISEADYARYHAELDAAHAERLREDEHDATYKLSERLDDFEQR